MPRDLCVAESEAIPATPERARLRRWSMSEGGVPPWAVGEPIRACFDKTDRGKRGGGIEVALIPLTLRPRNQSDLNPAEKKGADDQSAMGRETLSGESEQDGRRASGGFNFPAPLLGLPPMEAASPCRVHTTDAARRRTEL
jgi:hypothetical protein